KTFPPTRPRLDGETDAVPESSVRNTRGTTSICSSRRNRSPKGCTTAIGGPTISPTIKPTTNAMANFQISGNAKERCHVDLRSDEAGFTSAMSLLLLHVRVRNLHTSL